jgi:hypothetical protein
MKAKRQCDNQWRNQWRPAIGNNRRKPGESNVGGVAASAMKLLKTKAWRRRKPAENQ